MIRIRVARLSVWHGARALLVVGAAARDYRVTPAPDGTVAPGERRVTRHADAASRALTPEESPFLTLAVVREDAHPN